MLFYNRVVYYTKIFLILLPRTVFYVSMFFCSLFWLIFFGHTHSTPAKKMSCNTKCVCGFLLFLFFFFLSFVFWFLVFSYRLELPSILLMFLSVPFLIIPSAPTITGATFFQFLYPAL